ncbi:hypothetical protein E2493_07960 [Sphingomonas parva]|uniref:Uncharacterized protein n=1 Tax=Sphingomonas parva TaxID=2555898 RepID=A0A4Y8ZRY5_9SPHN|nr:hypothetical protein [Sphingomonas parva]TFI58790.1 hypothetical protein E2493_07960 [Sphingomonas parva]
MRTIIGTGLAAAALLLTGCGGGDSSAPTAEESEELNNAAEMLDTSADSLAVENAPLGNGDVPAAVPEGANVSDEAPGNAAANPLPPEATTAQ